jgi:L-ascorbate metabolism protein UlaG (beta-lactamase superfamily)
MGSGRFEIEPRPGNVRDLLEASSWNGLAFAWLGQAGFAVRAGDLRVLIDPYLSDTLAEKYRGKEFPHIRMMEPPLEPEEARADWVLCSHRHTDHMDPGTLPAVARRNPQCRFVAPRAEAAAAEKQGLPTYRTVLVGEGERIELGPDCWIEILASAHEDLRRDEAGDPHFLGFLLHLGGAVLYHSGDCVPYEGLADRLAPAGIHAALLPCNGRDAYRRERGVPGNMSLDEAVELCRAAGVPQLIPHHFGLFSFNTADPERLAQVEAAPGPPRVIVPRTDAIYWMTPSEAQESERREREQT